MSNKASKKSYGLIIAIIAICFGVGFGIGFYGTKIVRYFNAPSDGEYTVTVCATTDMHGSYFDKDFDGTTKKSSLANVSSFLKELRSTGCDPILLDCGDNLQGSNAAYFYNYVDTAETHIFTKMQQYLGYEALAVGNHDIETGHPVYDRLRKEAGIPMLACNAKISEGRKAGETYFDEYTIINRGKIRIAVIGMTNPNIKCWLAESLWKGIDFLSIASIAQEIVDKVNEKENPHITVLAIHSGNGLTNSDIENEGFLLAQTLNGVDLILCGHDHKTASQIVGNPNGDILLMDSGSHAKTISDIDLKVTIKNRKVESVTPVEYKIVDMCEYSPDPEFVEYFAPDYNKIYEFANKPIAQLNKSISFDIPMDGPSEYLTLIHKTQLNISGADISFAAPLAVHDGVSEGDVNFNTLSKIYQYENTLDKIEMTGQQIKDYLEFSYDNWINNTAARYNLDSADGINYTVSRSKEKGNRVNISTLCDGRAFSCDSTYTVALTSYRACGGGYLLSKGAGMNTENLQRLEQFKDIRSLIGDYMKQFPEGYTPEINKNWSFVE